MGIAALPQATVRVLGASQVLTDPSAVVKELLDNAYDANATSIAVEIHSNTIDIIQVRDNGHGIAPEDRALTARRYCTSKISHDEQLKDIGGSSLGFRGEALASAAELSGSLTISTRIEGEQVAAALRISQVGEVVGQEKASLPVGTTVRITDFIKANPVRRQVVLKGTENCLKKMKRTMQAYAFARPHVRLSLRVLKAKNNKGDWIYAPKMNGNAEDASFKVVGAGCASQCTWSVMECSGFSFHAFLPRLDADASKISNVGPFISVDARPVSSARGIFKQISKIFREALRKGADSMADVKDPFLYLEIQCPEGSYDANLEPAKDDLLFEDASIVVDTARKLFATAYEQQETQAGAEVEAEAEAEALRPETADMPRRQLQQDLDDIASGTPQRMTPGHVIQAYQPDVDADTVADHPDMGQSISHDDELPTRSTYRSNMYGCDEEDLETLDQRPSTSQTEADFAELRQSRTDITVSNPWIAAKLNASVRRSTPTADAATSECDGSDRITPTAAVARSSSPLKQSTLASAALPTPRPSSPSPVPNEGFHPSHYAPNLRIARDGRIIGSSALPPSELYTPMASLSPEYNYTPASDSPRGTPVEAVPDISTRPRRSPRKGPWQVQLNRPFVSPMVEQSPCENVWFDHLQDAERPRAQPKKRRPNAHGNHNGLVAQGELGDLAEDPRPITPPRRNRDIRDFVGRQTNDSIATMIERRNYTRPTPAARAATPEHEVLDLSGSTENDPDHRLPSGFVPVSEIMGLKDRIGLIDERIKNPPKRRKTSERRALQELDANAAIRDTATTFDEDEYRPETSKRTLSRRKSSYKLGRTKSCKLPLERIPPWKGTHDLAFTYSVSANDLAHMTGKCNIADSLLGFNEPALPAAYGMDLASSHVLSLTASLHGLLVSAGGDSDVTGPAALLLEVKAAFTQRNDADNSAVDDEMLMSSAA